MEFTQHLGMKTPDREMIDMVIYMEGFKII